MVNRRDDRSAGVGGQKSGRPPKKSEGCNWKHRGENGIQSKPNEAQSENGLIAGGTLEIFVEPRFLPSRCFIFLEAATVRWRLAEKAAARRLGIEWW